MSHFVDLAGRRFGLWVVGVRASNTKQGSARWYCQCDCGANGIVTAGNLHNGGSTGCGCTKPAKVIAGNTTHGHTSGGAQSSEYGTWCSMIQRCINPKVQYFAHYGGRGITVCNRWCKSFEDFIADMGPRPSPQHSLDRFPDNDGNYEPGNCRWATQSEQARNRRNNVIVDFNGELRPIVEWAERFNLDSGVLRYRLHRGWPIEKALTKPVASKKQLLSKESTSMNLRRAITPLE
jgi:hypothetical protein